MRVVGIALLLLLVGGSIGYAADTCRGPSCVWIPLVSEGSVPISTQAPAATAVVSPTSTPKVTPTRTPTPTSTSVAPTPTPSNTPSPTPTPSNTPSPTHIAEDPYFTQITWSTVASQPYSNSEAQSAVVGGKLYSFGGFDSTKPCCTPTRRVFVYDPTTNTWTRLADMPKGITHGGFTSDNEHIYYAGGYIEGTGGNQIFGTTQVWKYTIVTDSYTPLPSLPSDHAAGILALVGRDLHYLGGTNKARTEDVGNHIVLSLDGGTSWTRAAPLPNPRHHMGGVVLDGKIYVIGGQHKHDQALVPQNAVHRYDPTTDTWEELPSLPVARNHMTNSTFVMDGRIIVTGGQVHHHESLANVTAYDPKTNQWTELTPLPRAIDSAVAGTINGRIFFSTGGTKTTYMGIPRTLSASSVWNDTVFQVPLQESKVLVQDNPASLLYFCR